MSKACLVVALLSLLSYCSAGDPVPLLAWSNSESLSEVTSQSDLQDIISQIKINEFKVAVILTADELSFDDLALFGGVYGEKNAPLTGVQTLVSQSASSLTAGLSGQQPASQLATTLSFAMDAKPIYSMDPSDWPVLSGEHLVVLGLPQGRDEDTFRQHNSIITKVVSALTKSNLPYAVFYTSDHSEMLHSDTNKNIVRRSAPAGGVTLDLSNGQNDKMCFTIDDTEANNCTKGNSTCPACILFCMTPDVLHVNKSTNNATGTIIARANGTEHFTKIDGACNTTGTELFPDLYPQDTSFAFIAFNVEFSIDNSTEMFNKTMLFSFVRGVCKKPDDENNATRITLCGFWTMQLFAGDAPDSVEHHDQFHSEKVFSRFAVPLTKKGMSKVSYACGNTTQNRFVKTYNRSDTKMDSFQIVGLQVEPFTSLTPINNKFHFSSAFNCQSYLSHVSFMGVVSILILFIILYISTVFIFSIVSIDRFDDPRGTTIKVENLH